MCPRSCPTSVRANLPQMKSELRNHAQQTQRLKARLYVLFHKVSFHDDLRTRLVQIPYCYAIAAPVKPQNCLDANPE